MEFDPTKVRRIALLESLVDTIRQECEREINKEGPPRHSASFARKLRAILDEAEKRQ